MDLFAYNLLDEPELMLAEETEEDEEVATCALLVQMAMEDAQHRHSETRNPHRLYLTRADLLPNPRINTPWQHLYTRQNDRAFITTMGVNFHTFSQILNGGFALQWNTTPIPRVDSTATGAPRLGRRSLDAAGALGLVLHYLNSTMSETSLQEIFALIPATVSRYLNFSMAILLEALRSMPEAKVTWPTHTQEYNELSELIQSRHSLLQGAFGFIDGLNLAVQVSDDDEIENATYNGWLHDHFISNILVFSPKGTIYIQYTSMTAKAHLLLLGLIIGCRLNAPGSWHDAKIAQPIYAKLREHTPDGFYLVADTAFPRGTQSIQNRIKTPLKEGSKLPRDPQKRQSLLSFNRQLLSCRQAAEWGMRTLQGSFGRLRMPLQISNSKARAELLEVCVRLQNVRTSLVGINQIRNTFEPIWRASDDLWDTFGDALITDISKKDRVSKFHVQYYAEE